jgi:nitrate/nitrite transporter NarK
MQGEEEIFCDEQSRYDMMTRVYKGRMIPLLVLFCALLVPQFILNVAVYHNYGIAIMYGVILGLYVTVFATCMKKRKEFREHLGL